MSQMTKNIALVIVFATLVWVVRMDAAAAPWWQYQLNEQRYGDELWWERRRERGREEADREAERHHERFMNDEDDD